MAGREIIIPPNPTKEVLLYSLYQMVLKSLTSYLGIDQEKKRAGRPPKVSDLQLCTLLILSYHPASYHEVRSLRIRYRKSKWLRFLVDRFGLMGDRGYRGCEYVGGLRKQGTKGHKAGGRGCKFTDKAF